MTARHVLIDTGPYTLEGTIAADADLDGVFDLVEEGTGATLHVAGWLIDSIEDVQAPARSAWGMGA